VVGIALLLAAGLGVAEGAVLLRLGGEGARVLAQRVGHERPGVLGAEGLLDLWGHRQIRCGLGRLVRRVSTARAALRALAIIAGGTWAFFCLPGITSQMTRRIIASTSSPRDSSVATSLKA